MICPAQNRLNVARSWLSNSHQLNSIDRPQSKSSAPTRRGNLAIDPGPFSGRPISCPGHSCVLCCGGPSSHELKSFLSTRTVYPAILCTTVITRLNQQLTKSYCYRPLLAQISAIRHARIFHL